LTGRHTTASHPAPVDQRLDRPPVTWTVHEDYELIDTGVVDAAGNKIMARNRMDQIGFVRSKA